MKQSQAFANFVKFIGRVRPLVLVALVKIDAYLTKWHFISLPDILVNDLCGVLFPVSIRIQTYSKDVCFSYGAYCLSPIINNPGHIA